MDNSDSPPSPLHSPPDSPATTRSSSRRSGEPKRHRSSKHLGSSSKELAKLLIFEEREAQDLRNTLHNMSERLKMETQRADEAESRAKEVVFRFKEANDARLLALAEASRYREELNLYKLQLDNAQKELRRAQELLDSLESQRLAAEEDAARARGMARKLKEEKVIQVARDEGRKLGIEEGIARGRAMGYEEGRAAGFARGKSSATKEYMQRYEAADYDLPGPPIRISVSSSDDSSPIKQPSPIPPPAQQGTPPEDIRIASPGSNNIYFQRSTTPTDFQTTNPRSSVHSFTQMTADYPQDDGFIPRIDDDGRVRLPPPHELASSPAASPPAPTPALMVPPPLPPQPSAEPETPTEPTSPGRPRYRRRRSTESNSTTMSQFDILGPPVASSGRNIERPVILSAIVEEKERSSTVSSPQNIGSSPYAYASSPNFASMAAQPEPGYAVAPEEPPSRPDSHMSQSEGVLQEPGLLTADDAARPPAPEEPAAPSEPAPIIAPHPTGSLSALQLPLQLPADGQLPPGFVPMGPPQTGSRTPGVLPNLGGMYTNPNTPAAVPLPPSAAPTTSRLYTPSVAGSHIPSADPGVVIPPPSAIAHRYSRTALRDSSESEDASSVSSGISGSMDSLTTPPQRKKSFKRPPSTPYATYATAPTPPDVTYPLPIPTPQGPPTPMSMASGTSRAAKVPLPPSTVAGSPTKSALSIAGGSTSRAVKPNSHMGEQSELFSLSNTVAQDALDEIWQILRDPAVTQHRTSQRQLLRLLLKLVLRYDKLPTFLLLQGVRCLETESRGSGGFADVFYGEYESAPVALKRLRVYAAAPASQKAKLRQAFLREAILWMNLSHTNVLPFAGVAEEVFKNPTLCMVLPWMPNGNIRQYRDEMQGQGKLDGPLFDMQISQWLQGIAEGIAYLHQEGIVHGDIHGGNILVDADGTMKLTDFGMALIADATSYNYASIHGGGATRWQAPELHAPEEFGMTSRRPTGACDVYSFAYLCIELFSGEIPFKDLSDFQVVTRVVRGERPERPKKPNDEPISEDGWSLVVSCWTVPPSDRPTSEQVATRLGVISTSYARTSVRDSDSQNTSIPADDSSNSSSSTSVSQFFDIREDEESTVSTSHFDVPQTLHAHEPDDRSTVNVTRLAPGVASHGLYEAAPIPSSVVYPSPPGAVYQSPLPEPQIRTRSSRPVEITSLQPDLSIKPSRYAAAPVPHTVRYPSPVSRSRTSRSRDRTPYVTNEKGDGTPLPPPHDLPLIRRSSSSDRILAPHSHRTGAPSSPPSEREEQEIVHPPPPLMKTRGYRNGRPLPMDAANDLEDNSIFSTAPLVSDLVREAGLPRPRRRAPERTRSEEKEEIRLPPPRHLPPLRDASSEEVRNLSPPPSPPRLKMSDLTSRASAHDGFDDDEEEEEDIVSPPTALLETREDRTSRWVKTAAAYHDSERAVALTPWGSSGNRSVSTTSTWGKLKERASKFVR
ncbi:hypothetical protein EIP91_008588 [Steccherinum ochraceum]|uniref:Protein kinase domain-containing protein n=1 Tax=Steccherinum ochraceum TaxID=92696 RepID=A0A4V2MV70_9APHY|nr:hypothetical protein EIP91_008588 [Steccherinum ochraceum]